MEDNIKCYKSNNIGVYCDINFVDRTSLKITIKQLKTIKTPNKIIREMIKELEECL